MAGGPQIVCTPHAEVLPSVVLFSVREVPDHMNRLRKVEWRKLHVQRSPIGCYRIHVPFVMREGRRHKVLWSRRFDVPECDVNFSKAQMNQTVAAENNICI